jgi:hypothetical protein
VTAPATSLVVAMAWLRTIPAIADIVASDLPAVEKWASPDGHGFVTVGPVVGGGGASPLTATTGTELYAPMRHPIVQIDFWAAFANSKKINHGVAQENAGAVWDACYTDFPDEITMPAGVKPVHLTPVYPVSPDLLGPIPDPNNYAHYQLALHIGWIHQGAVPGVVG